MRDPILASKFNRPQPFFSVRPLLYQFHNEAGFRNRDIKGLLARAPTALLTTVQISAVPARGRWQILPNVTIPF